MTPSIRSQGFSITSAIRAHLERRFTLALDEFSGRITRVDVSLKDLNGADKGGEDKSVLVHVQLPAQAPVTVETTSHDLYLAISLGARRTRRALFRSLRRHQRFERAEVRRFRLPGPVDTAMSG
jgi:ribosomal subunit interface protein